MSRSSRHIVAMLAPLTLCFACASAPRPSNAASDAAAPDGESLPPTGAPTPNGEPTNTPPDGPPQTVEQAR
jgi:hypothetical protein